MRLGAAARLGELLLATGVEAAPFSLNQLDRLGQVGDRNGLAVIGEQPLTTTQTGNDGSSDSVRRMTFLCTAVPFSLRLSSTASSAPTSDLQKDMRQWLFLLNNVTA